MDWLANWGCWNRGKEIDSEGLPHLHPEEKSLLQRLLDIDKGGKGMIEMNGQDQAARSEGGENLQQLGMDSTSVGTGRRERHEQIGQVTGQGRSGRREDEDVRIETALRKDLETAPKFRIMDRGRTTGGIRSKGRLRQEQPGGYWNNDA